MDCRFCELVLQKSERILQESERVFVVLSDPRLMPGHMLVIPKRHVEKLAELSNEELDEFMCEVIRVEEVLLKKFPGCDISQHFRPFIPENPLKVNHLHMHVRPRALDDELYMKVQKYEKDVFQKVEDEEIIHYKKLLVD